jgi:hypothetical protein
VDGDDVVEVDASGGVVSVTLPPCSQSVGRLLSVIKTDSSANGVTIAASGTDTIDGGSTFSITLQYGAAWFYSDGSKWVALVRKFGSGFANQVVRTGDGGGEPMLSALDAADIPSLPASKITSGQLPPAYGGTGALNTGASGDILIGQGTSFTEHAVSGDVSLAATGAATVTGLHGYSIPSSTPGSLFQHMYDPHLGQYMFYQSNGPVYATVVATSNVTLSGLTTIDGVGINDGSTVLCTGQTVGSQNGLWISHTGAWTRISPYWNTGNTAPYGFLIYVSQGTTHGRTMWSVTSGGANVIDTDTIAFAQTLLGAGGSVTSVGLSMPSDFSVSGSPVTSSGTLTVAADSQAANTFKAGPASGGAAAPSFRAIVPADLPAATASTFGAVMPDNSTISIASGVISVASGVPTTPFAVWGSGTTYAQYQVVLGTDGNLYQSQVNSNLNNNPVGDNGTNWKLWALQANLLLNCGVGQTFADTFASFSNPGGAMMPGIQSAHDFIAKAVGAVSPSQATITIQQANNPSTTCNALGTTTTVKTSLNIPIGASIMFKGDVTVALKGATTTVTGSSYSSGTYTLTVNALSNAPTSGDTFYYAPYYGTSTININLPILGPNVTVLGTTSTPVCPTFYPSVSASGSGSSLSATTYYIALSYLWTDASGTQRETLTGPVTSQTPTSGQNLVVGSFSVPVYASGVNVYASSTLGGTLHKQGSMTVSGGVASAYTMSSYNTGGSSAPTSNAPASAWPCAMTWGNANGILIVGTANLTMNGFYLYGPGGTTYNGISLATSNGFCLGNATFTNRTVSTSAMVLSNWNFCLSIGQQSYVDCSFSQFDNSARGTQVFAASVRAINCVSQRATSFSFNVSQGQINAQTSFSGFNTQGYTATAMSYINSVVSSVPTSGTAQPDYGTTTPTNPTTNTIGNQNSYIQR